MVLGTFGGRGDGRESKGSLSYIGFVLSCLASFTFPLGAGADVYMVLVEGEPVVSYRGSVPGFVATDDFSARSSSFSMAGVQAVQAYSTFLLSHQDSLLDNALGSGTYTKLYGYHHLVNGFAVDITADQIL